MAIYEPDPHPGRCLNYRHGKRCLDYDSKPHICTFPPPDHPAVTITWSSSTTVPLPWIKPSDREGPPS